MKNILTIFFIALLVSCATIPEENLGVEVVEIENGYIIKLDDSLVISSVGNSENLFGEPFVLINTVLKSEAEEAEIEMRPKMAGRETLIENIFFPDKRLEAAIKKIGAIYAEDLMVLNLEDRGIVSLEGLEYFVNLIELNISSNYIANISSLEKMVQLEVLDVSNNPIVDISSLEGKRYLEYLNLSGTNVFDSHTLWKLSLKELCLGGVKLSISQSEALKNELGEDVIFWEREKLSGKYLRR